MISVVIFPISVSDASGNSIDRAVVLLTINMVYESHHTILFAILYSTTSAISRVFPQAYRIRSTARRTASAEHFARPAMADSDTSLHPDGARDGGQPCPMSPSTPPPKNPHSVQAASAAAAAPASHRTVNRPLCSPSPANAAAALHSAPAACCNCGTASRCDVAGSCTCVDSQTVCTSCKPGKNCHQRGATAILDQPIALRRTASTPVRAPSTGSAAKSAPSTPAKQKQPKSKAPTRGADTTRTTSASSASMRQQPLSLSFVETRRHSDFKALQLIFEGEGDRAISQAQADQIEALCRDYETLQERLTHAEQYIITAEKSAATAAQKAAKVKADLLRKNSELQEKNKQYAASAAAAARVPSSASASAAIHTRAPVSKQSNSTSKTSGVVHADRLAQMRAAYRGAGAVESSGPQPKHGGSASSAVEASSPPRINHPADWCLVATNLGLRAGLHTWRHTTPDQLGSDRQKRSWRDEPRDGVENFRRCAANPVEDRIPVRSRSHHGAR